MKVLALIFITVLSVPFWCGCGGSGVNATLAELVTQPQQYSGKTVTVEGIYLNDWAVTVLADDVRFIGGGDTKELEIYGNSIWFSGFLSKEIREELYSYTSPEAGPQRYGKIRATGVFETEGKYGNMNQYRYRITVDSAELLDWTPPQ
jgi:hypothetical protein